jgi:hypothetical protein
MHPPTPAGPVRPPRLPRVAGSVPPMMPLADGSPSASAVPKTCLCPTATTRPLSRPLCTVAEHNPSGGLRSGTTPGRPGPRFGPVGRVGPSFQDKPGYRAIYAVQPEKRVRPFRLVQPEPHPPPTKVPTGGGAAAAPPEAGVEREGVPVGVENGTRRFLPSVARRDVRFLPGAGAPRPSAGYRTVLLRKRPFLYSILANLSDSPKGISTKALNKTTKVN